MRTKVSVLIAAYNAEQYIGRCLRSLLDQTYPRESLEVLVVDDGSVDRTSFAIELFADGLHSPVKLIRGSQNQGLPAALNRGLEIASGAYVVRVDADDFVNRDFVNFLASYLDANLSLGAVGCDYLLVNDDESVIDQVRCDEHPIACGIMFRKKCLENIGRYDESFRCNEDVELRIRFDKQYVTERLAVPLYRYRRHENNMTNDDKEMAAYKNMVIEKHG